MIYKIFGKNVKFKIESSKLAKLLENNLSLYPLVNNNSKIDVEVILKDKNPLDDILRLKFLANPKNHISFEDGFLIDYGSIITLFEKKEILYIRIYIKPEQQIRKFLLKFLSMDFGSIFDIFGNVLHELILIPMTFFFDDLIPIHAMAIKSNKTFNTYLIGGTGGVGKTSTEIFLCKQKYFSFISDDISIIDINGNVYPNLSPPKIYAYNLENDPLLKKKIFYKRGFIDKFHWYLMKRVRGLSKVRRILYPTELCNSIEYNKNSVNKYFLLFVNNVKKELYLETIQNKREITIASKNIILNEYHSFIQHIIWHEYNSQIMKIKPIISLSKFIQKYENIMDRILSKIETYIIYKPYNIDHNQFLNFMYFQIK